MFIKHFKNIVLCIVIAGGFSARAGSYDDFFIAIRNDNAGAVTDLLQRGFDPNTRDPKGQPGLTIAMQERALKAARALLDRPETDVNALNQAGESALMMAALKGDLAGAQLLLERGAKVNQAGWSPLHYAAAGPEPKLVQLLIERGADIDAASPNGTTPLMMAAQYGREASVDLLLSHGADPKRRNERNLDAVDFARLSGRDWLVKQLEARPR
ncbi:MAG TPA: ankyrin repeat domain-containing protein [Burkholderiaceae bacterium]